MLTAIELSATFIQPAFTFLSLLKHIQKFSPAYVINKMSHTWTYWGKSAVGHRPYIQEMADW